MEVKPGIIKNRHINGIYYLSKIRILSNIFKIFLIIFFLSFIITFKLKNIVDLIP